VVMSVVSLVMQLPDGHSSSRMPQLTERLGNYHHAEPRNVLWSLALAQGVVDPDLVSSPDSGCNPNHPAAPLSRNVPPFRTALHIRNSTAHRLVVHSRQTLTLQSGRTSEMGLPHTTGHVNTAVPVHVCVCGWTGCSSDSSRNNNRHQTPNAPA